MPSSYLYITPKLFFFFAQNKIQPSTLCLADEIKSSFCSNGMQTFALKCIYLKDVPNKVATKCVVKCVGGSLCARFCPIGVYLCFSLYSYVLWISCCCSMRTPWVPPSVMFHSVLSGTDCWTNQIQESFTNDLKREKNPLIQTKRDTVFYQ